MSQGGSPGGSEVGRLLGVVINDSVVDVPGEAVVVGLQELVVSGVLDQVGRPQAVQVELARHIAHHQAAAVRGPVAVHQLNGVRPAAMGVWAGVLGGETAGRQGRGLSRCWAAGSCGVLGEHWGDDVDVQPLWEVLMGTRFVLLNEPVTWRKQTVL